METNHIFVDGDEEKLKKALEEAGRFADYQHFENKNALRLRLMTEELLGMFRGIAGEYKAMFWVEGSEAMCHLNLEARVQMDKEKRRELLSASSSGKNAAAVGIAGKIRDMIESGLQSFDESAKIATESGTPIAFYSLGMDPSQASLSAIDWSLSRYKEQVGDQQEESEAENTEAWDELEKSIIANLADDVRVGITKNQVKITIDKNFKK